MWNPRLRSGRMKTAQSIAWCSVTRSLGASSRWINRHPIKGAGGKLWSVIGMSECSRVQMAGFAVCARSGILPSTCGVGFGVRGIFG